ncbi:MAG: hypothetical protein OXD44_01830 [Gammaproteobacteria bacterium]|nr:hypothetical protein [Gammaproteobacteria bacterium]
MQYGKTWKHAPGKVLSRFAVRAGQRQAVQAIQGLKQRAAREPPDYQNHEGGS